MPFSLGANETIINYWKNNSKTTTWREPTGAQNLVIPESDFNIISVNNTNGSFEGYTYFITADGSGNAINKWFPIDVSGTHFANSQVYYTLHTYDPTATAITEIENADHSLVTYPNPASSVVNVTFKETASENSVAAVYDVAGNKIWELKFKAGYDNQFEINTTHFEQGIYILEVNTDKIKERTKIVICR